MELEVNKDVAKAAIEEYGSISQYAVAVEEMAELSTLLGRMLRGRPADIKDIVDEIADVTIVLNQLRIIVNQDKWIQRRIEEKEQRLAERIDMNRIEARDKDA